jgi:hypothetical protein
MYGLDQTALLTGQAYLKYVRARPQVDDVLAYMSGFPTRVSQLNKVWNRISGSTGLAM